ncbi:MAG: ABC transporter ATP-binding protein [Sulfurimonas sp.]|uniref:ABC transporter ATP-binding protein n=1 Tax=Sulfurimonas sp. TaxID=2022749 RepID=UPI0025F16110|nr:ABC transporter ATP-binding protein [Sulfurimonas sp.]MCK9490908.1 ABC transporter ATP-binding protein [Sulfurimonas sp.]
MIELKNVTKSYEINKNNIVVALNDVSMKIGEGELVVLRGASGSGKSSVLSLIAALSKPTTGEVIVDTKQISKLPDNFASEYRRDNIGFVFQKYNLITTLSVKENILLPLVPLNPDPDDADEKLTRVMEMFKISHKKDAIIKNLSGGEQQRVAIARANVNEPKIIIADEPTANLDEKLSLHFIEMLKELKKLNKTIVIATHDPLFFGLDIVDREIEMHNGAII